MPGKIKVKVLAGRNLPVMDRAGDTTDAFVEIKFGGITHKTDVCRKSLNPQWNSMEWYRFEVDESELQDEPLQLRLMDHDTYSANDAIGKVVISLAPLLARETTNSEKGGNNGAVMSGWIPVFDTMHGIRGELNVIVKVELFSDFNKYKTSSCGVQFFHCPMIPPGYRATAVHGFVEELVVNDDPEYQWIDKIRTPRASNEARQVAFIKLSNQVQRLVGLKAAELGANAVVGYQQDFDLEGEAGVVARAVGTAVSIVELPVQTQPQTAPLCSQQQLKKYLNILTSDNENITDLNEYFQTHREELDKMMHILHPKFSSNFLDETDNIEDFRSESTRQSSLRSYTDNMSIYQDDFVSQNSFKTISEDQLDLNRLLHKEDEESLNPLKKMKKMRRSLFRKRFGSIRSKNDDNVSLNSNSSDVSRLSIDIRKEFKKLRRIKKPKFHNDDDDGVGMASILARSVMHAHSNLDCIDESIDSESSPQNTLRKISESLDEQKDIPEIRYASMTNIDMDQLPDTSRKLSESCPSTPIAKRPESLNVPSAVGLFGSESSALSGESSEMYTTSEDDDESSDPKTDTDRSLETTSYVVKKVLENVDKNVVAQVDNKLRELDVLTPEPEVSSASTSQEDKNFITINSIKKDTNPTKPNLNVKIHKFFSHKKSISEPSSPGEKLNIVHRSSNKIKQQFSKITKSFSHMTLVPKKKKMKKPLSQPSSTSDFSKSNSHETVLGSPFLSYTDLQSLDKESEQHHDHRKFELFDSHKKVEMYIGSEPASRASISGPSSLYSGLDYQTDHKPTKLNRKDKKTLVKNSGLIKTAMETILMDKVQSLLLPTPEIVGADKQFFHDVNIKLEKIEESRKQEKKLVRQDSVQSEDQSLKSCIQSDNQVKVSTPTPPKTPMLQKFHPILSGKPLQTIPSASESTDQAQSLDEEEQVEPNPHGQTNVCVNKHAACDVGRESEKDKGSPLHARHESFGAKEAQTQALLNASTPVGVNMHRRSSDSDLSVTPKGGSLNASLGNAGSGGGAILRPSMNTNNLEMLEYPFLTMTEFPPGFIVHIGGAVCARSVKLGVGGVGESSRESHWGEVRTEMRAHARAARCHAVIGYSETTTICEEVCVLSASGTAAIINLDCDYNADPETYLSLTGHNIPKATLEENTNDCSLAHVPYSTDSGTYRPELSICGGCKRARVPAVMLATCSKPTKLSSIGKTVPLTACAARVRRSPACAEPGARDISDQLPFLEYELHKLLLAKLRMQGANAMFNLHTSIAIGERCVIALASGAAVRLNALPAPSVPTIKATENDKSAIELQKALRETFNANKTANGYDVGVVIEQTSNGTTDNEDDPPVLDLCNEKDAFVLEIDESEDVETARALSLRRPQVQLFTNDMKAVAGAPPQAFAQICRARLSLSGSATWSCERHLMRAINGAMHKLRRMKPCAVLLPSIQIELPEDEIQLLISGTAIRIQDKPEVKDKKCEGDSEDSIFTFDEEIQETVNDNVSSNTQCRVILTSLSYVSGAKIVRRVCALRALFVRETTAVREMGGLSGFLHTFTSEVLAILRAYTAALGGNALTSFYLRQLMLQDNAHKNQGQCLLSVGGDVVHCTF